MMDKIWLYSNCCQFSLILPSCCTMKYSSWIGSHMEKISLYSIFLSFFFLLLFLFLFLFQVATALLVAGSTLTAWILGRLRLHPPAHTQASFKALGCSYNCMRLTCGSFQLTHMSRDNTLFNASSHGGQKEDKRYYSAHNVATRVSFDTQASVHDSDHYDVDRIFMGFSWELHYRIVRSSDGGQRGEKRAHNSTTKVSFCTIIILLCRRMIAITRV